MRGACAAHAGCRSPRRSLEDSREVPLSFTAPACMAARCQTRVRTREGPPLRSVAGPVRACCPTRRATWCHSVASEASEESARAKLIDSVQLIEVLRGIDQATVLQIPPRALRALVGMTNCAGVSELGNTPGRVRWAQRGSVQGANGAGPSRARLRFSRPLRGLCELTLVEDCAVRTAHGSLRDGA
jgi:hypothetical protein